VLSPLLSQQGDQTVLHCAHSFFDARRARHAGRARWAKRGGPGGFPTARIQRGPPSLSLHHFRGEAKVALDCAHRTSTVSSCAFCEQGGHLAAPLLILLRPRVARAQRAVWLPCFPRACWAPPGFSSNKTLKSMRSNQAGSTTSWWKRAHASSFTPG
jgi:hypothetical protein